MHLISVNVGTATPIANAKSVGVTGIFKQPQSDPVQIDTLGLAHDSICDTDNHGGVDQAVYVFGQLDCDWWSNELGYALAPGTFGDNLTISDFASMDYNVGDYLQVGAVRLQVTAPRIPCVTLAVRMNDPAFVKRFRHAERPGIYCRVITAGAVQAGDPVSVERYTGVLVSALEFFRLGFERDHAVDTMRRLLEAPIDIRTRKHFTAKLAAHDQA